MKAILVCFAFVSLAAAKLPSYFKTCSRDDPEINQCFVDFANDALKTFLKGDTQLKTPVLVPVFKYEGRTYQPSDEFFLHIKETDIVGADTMKIIDAKVDFNDKTIWFKYKYDVLDCNGTYLAKALKEKDEVEDKSHIIFTDNTYIFNMKFDVNDNHMSVVNITVVSDGKHTVEYNFDNIEKHPAISVLWDKYREDYEHQVLAAITKLATYIFGQVFKESTYDEMFPIKA